MRISVSSWATNEADMERALEAIIRSAKAIDYRGTRHREEELRSDPCTDRWIELFVRYFEGSDPRPMNVMGTRCTLTSLQCRNCDS